MQGIDDTMNTIKRQTQPPAEIRGRNSVVECQLPKLDVGSSNLLARCAMGLSKGETS